MKFILTITILLFFIAAGAQDTTVHFRTYLKKHDTLKVTTIPQRIFIAKYDTTMIASGSYNDHFTSAYTVQFAGAVANITPDYDTIAAHDSVIICGLCAVHDTTERYLVITPPLPTGESATHWGVLILNDQNTPLAQRIHQAKNIASNLTTFRYGYDRGDDHYSVKQIQDSGMLVAMNYANRPVQETAYFPTGAALDAAAATLDSLLTIRKPDLLCIENEEGNQNYHRGSPQDYIAELNRLTAVAHAHNVPVSNGGIISGIIFYIRKYYQDNGKTDSVAWLNNAAGLGPGETSLTRQQLDYYNVVIPAYAASNIDYINFHHYEPPRRDTTPTVESQLTGVVIDFLRSHTGKPVIMNEFGTGNHSHALLNELCHVLNDHDVKWVVYFDGNGIEAFANEAAYSFFLNSLLAWLPHGELLKTFAWW